MKSSIAIVVLVLSPLFGTSVAAAPLDLRQLERLALEENLDLRAVAFDVGAATATIAQGHGVYDPLARLSLLAGSYREGINRAGTTAATASAYQYQRFDLTLGQKLPTGGELDLSYANGRNDDRDPTFTFFNPSWRSELRLSLMQPLLKGRGRTITEQEILFATQAKDAALQDFRLQAVTVLAQVRNLFFEVLRFRQIVVFREASVTLAEQILEENRARVAAGVLPPVDILEAEVGLKQRERELLDARQILADTLDQLTVLLNAGDTPIEVADEALTQLPFAPAPEVDLAAAPQLRPELLRRTSELASLSLQERLAANSTLPAVNFAASYAQKGLGGDYGEALDQLGSDQLRNWEVGLNLSYPLGNRSASNAHLASRLRLLAAQSGFNRLGEEVRREIRAAVRQLQIGQLRIEVTAKGRDLAEEKLRSLLKRREVGLSTTRDVLEGEADLARARTDYTGALADYNRAITEYLRASGRLLDQAGVRFAAVSDPGAGRPLLEVADP